jgi:hypothetical protein
MVDRCRSTQGIYSSSSSGTLPFEIIKIRAFFMNQRIRYVISSDVIIPAQNAELLCNGIIPDDISARRPHALLRLLPPTTAEKFIGHCLVLKFSLRAEVRPMVTEMLCE